MTTRDSVVDEARTWVKTPWVHQARIKGVGVDCIGLIAGVAKELHLPLVDQWYADPRFTSYGRTPDPELLIAGCREYMDEIPIADAGLGDVLIMRARNVRQPTHFAIISRVDPLYIIHSRLLRKVAENRLDDALRALVLNAFRYRGVT